MKANRVEAFSDGVIAILITIMVLELKVPHGDTIDALAPLVPVFLSYLLSFIYLGIYWNNHHHLFNTVQKVSGIILWANSLLLFCLSLVPFTTGWMGENHFAATPMAIYGVSLLASAIAYFFLQYAIVCTHGQNSILKLALGTDWKGKLSPVLYLIAIGMAYVEPWVSGVLYVAVALIWFIPDKRIEKALHGR